MRRVLVGLACLASQAHAEPATSTLTIEGGAEADSNIQRVETGGGDLEMNHRISGSVVRFGGKLDRRGRTLGGGYGATASMLMRLVTNKDAKVENTALVGGDLRWLRALPKRPVGVGAGVSYIDAIPLSDATGARTFRSAGLDAMLVIRKADDRALTLSAGPRYFAYKPDHSFDWWAAAINARLDLTLWEPSGGARSLELAALLGFEARYYDSLAKANSCDENDPITESCLSPTLLERRDRYQRAGLELTYTGGVVATAAYALTVIDSTSFGQSIARHRATLTATRPIGAKLIGTLLATLQLDRYLDGLIVQKDLQHQEFTTLDDANRSSVQARLAYRVSDAWSLEARGAIWRDLGNKLDTEYRRELLYLGGVYTK